MNRNKPSLTHTSVPSARSVVMAIVMVVMSVVVMTVMIMVMVVVT